MPVIRRGNDHSIDVTAGDHLAKIDILSTAAVVTFRFITVVLFDSAPMRPYNSVLSPRGIHNHFPNWRAYREYSGGQHTDMGAHHYDIAHWALDLDRTGPVRIIPPENPARG